MFQLQILNNEPYLDEMSRVLQEQLQSVDIKNGSVSAKIAISKGTKFGPFVGKFSTEPLDRRFAWEVSSK